MTMFGALQLKNEHFENCLQAIILNTVSLGTHYLTNSNQLPAGYRTSFGVHTN